MRKEETQKEDLESLPCPSFNYYFTDQLPSITEQVKSPLNDDTDFEFTAFNNTINDEGRFLNDTVSSLVNCNLSDHYSSDLRVPMTTRLLTGAGDLPPSPSSDSSSSEADNLERISAKTYCLWSPYSPQATPKICEKSNSTGSSSLKACKVLDFLRRCNSEGKKRSLMVKKRKSLIEKEKKVAVSSAFEALYVRNRESKSVDKIKSFLPYRKNLFGLFCSGSPSL